MKGAYSAIIREDIADKVFYVDFPDFDWGECCTYGENVADALYMAWDVLNLMLCNYDGELPSPSKIKPKDEKEIISLVWYDTDEYKKFLEYKNSAAV